MERGNPAAVQGDGSADSDSWDAASLISYHSLARNAGQVLASLAAGGSPDSPAGRRLAGEAESEAAAGAAALKCTGAAHGGSTAELRSGEARRKLRALARVRALRGERARLAARVQVLLAAQQAGAVQQAATLERLAEALRDNLAMRERLLAQARELGAAQANTEAAAAAASACVQGAPQHAAGTEGATPPSRTQGPLSLEQGALDVSERKVARQRVRAAALEARCDDAERRAAAAEADAQAAQGSAAAAAALAGELQRRLLSARSVAAAHADSAAAPTLLMRSAGAAKQRLPPPQRQSATAGLRASLVQCRGDLLRARSELAASRADAAQAAASGAQDYQRRLEEARAAVAAARIALSERGAELAAEELAVVQAELAAAREGAGEAAEAAAGEARFVAMWQGEGAMRAFAAERDAATAERDAATAERDAAAAARDAAGAELAEAAAALAELARAAGCEGADGRQAGSVSDMCRALGDALAAREELISALLRGVAAAQGTPGLGGDDSPGMPGTSHGGPTMAAAERRLTFLRAIDRLQAFRAENAQLWRVLEAAAAGRADVGHAAEAVRGQERAGHLEAALRERGSLAARLATSQAAVQQLRLAVARVGAQNALLAARLASVVPAAHPGAPEGVAAALARRVAALAAERRVLKALARLSLAVTTDVLTGGTEAAHVAAAAGGLVAAHACELQRMGLAPAWATLQALATQPGLRSRWPAGPSSATASSFNPGPGHKQWGEDIWFERDALDRLQVLGGWTFGQILLGRWKCALIAVKVLKESRQRANTSAIAEFRWEAKLLRDMRHPCILNFYGTCSNGALMMSLTEYMAGGDLGVAINDDVAENGDGVRLRLGWYAGGRAVLLCVARGLAYLHSEKLVHGDLRSSDILLQDKQYLVAKIAELGKSRRISRMGTPAYMAPELLSKTPKTLFHPEAIHIFSFGVIMHETVNGHQPTFRRDMDAPKVPEDCSQGVADLWEKCVAIEPAVRPTAAEVEAALKDLLQVPRPNDQPPAAVQAALEPVPTNKFILQARM
ncbi:hypothetical protein WJX81_006002 [Elliptochloris bilobata]|uniref:Protein kinase domain-containing protein n=1 Tax=Elliptochloris bilobata TaxID=381761 RepID=A0AAW1RCP7_9CHLO